MADNKRPQGTKVMTPKGVLVFPNLNTPDRKFAKNGVGSYTARIRLTGDDSVKLLALIEAEGKKSLALAKAELEQKLADATTGKAKAQLKKELAELKLADASVKPCVDDDGEETGDYEFNFKMPESYVKDKGKPTEKVVPIKPDLFDAKGQILKNPPSIWGGTTAIVAGELRPFYTALAGAGVSLRLNAVQIIVLQSGSGSRDAGAYGFGAQDGYEADGEATSGGFSDQSGGSDKGSDSSSGPAANAF